MSQAGEHDTSANATRDWQPPGAFAFFHNHAFVAALKISLIPRLFAGKLPSVPVRVWVPGCAAGEGEVVYALLMLLNEHADTLATPPPIQIFATDNDEDMLASARAALFPATIEQTLSPERLRHFCERRGQEYKLKQVLRDQVVFARHDLRHDPPFARLDLVMCARHLSELGSEGEQQLLSLFHYGLQPNRYLALSPGDQASMAADQFVSVDGNAAIFQCYGAASPLSLVPPGSAGLGDNPETLTFDQAAVAMTVGTVHLRLLAQYSAPSVLIDEAYQILHVSRREPLLFQFPAGQLSRNLLDVIPNRLKPILRAALLQAENTNADQAAPAAQVLLNGALFEIRIGVRQLREPAWARGYFLVIFDRLAREQDGAGDRRAGPSLDMAAYDQQSWQIALRSYERAIESQISTRSALQSANEQLSALNEELAISQEQLSTVNAELQANNAELRRRVVELTRANDDLNNLIGATDIATVFLDSAFQITRFTPQAQQLFHMIRADLGRPIAHITHSLEYDQLPRDIAAVAHTLQRVEREVRGANDRWYLARVRPYCTVEERIDGVVLTFVDITERKLAEDALRQARDELEQRIVERTRELVVANAHLQAEIAERQELEEVRKQLLRALITSQEDERRRIARELHDQMGQSISALNLGLATLAEAAVAPQARRGTIARLQAIASQLDEDVDRLALELRPGVLDDLGLLAAVQQYTEEWSAHHAIALEFQATGMNDRTRLTPEIEMVLYRILQEALTNVLKHARAKFVSVILECRSDQVHLIVEDDGGGFDLAAQQKQIDRNAQRQLGLLGMHERLAFVDGSLTIDSNPGAGTTLFARIPIRSVSDEGHAHE